jgi:hypothetical protein
MFFTPNIKKPVFIKLFYYYCRKLRRKLWNSIFVLVLLVVFMVVYFLSFVLANAKITGSESFWETIKNLKNVAINNENLLLLNDNLPKYGNWKTFLFVFWVISFLQASFIYTAISPLVLVLNGVSYSQHLKKSLNWKEKMKELMDKKKKIINADDITVLTLVPGVNLETMVLAKFAAVMFFVATFGFVFFTLPLFCVLIWFRLSLTNLPWYSLSFFLITNSIFSVLDCWPLVAAFFASYEGGVKIASFISQFLWSMFVMALVVIAIVAMMMPELSGIIWLVPLLILLYFPLMAWNGYYFFNFYREKFLTRDLV